MNGIAAANFGRSRSGTFRSRGTALASASRTIRRCIPNFLATPFIVPAPCSYSRRICSYSSTLVLLFSKTYPPSGLASPKQDTWLLVYRGAKSEHRSGPIQSIELNLVGKSSTQPLHFVFRHERMLVDELLKA